MSIRSIKLSELGKGRRWAEYVFQHGDRIPIVDEDGREVAWLIPATEPVTAELIEELAVRHLTDEARENFLGWAKDLVGKPGCVYHRMTDTFRFER